MRTKKPTEVTAHKAKEWEEKSNTHPRNCVEVARRKKAEERHNKYPALESIKCSQRRKKVKKRQAREQQILLASEVWRECSPFNQETYMHSSC